MDPAAPPHLAAAVADARGALASLAAMDLAPGSAGEARALLVAVESLGRQAASLQVTALDALDRSGMAAVEGHRSAKVMVRHVANLSNPEAARRARVARALRSFPGLGAAFAAGRVGLCQVDRVAKAHANPRVRDRLVAREAEVVELAISKPYRVFDRLLSTWVDLVDADGAADRGGVNHRRRSARMVADHDGSWRLDGRFGSLQGAEVASILKRFEDLEFLADWQQASDVHGPETTVAHLARTPSQRRADAVAHIFRRAADAAASDTGGSQIVTNIVIDRETFERQLAQLAHVEHVEPVASAGPPMEVGAEPALVGDGRRCETVDGVRLDPAEVVGQALVGHVRRVVVGADSVVIDLGRKQRLFTGGARLAAVLADRECFWPGCQVPVSECQVDHLTAWSQRGPTAPHNGGPLCGYHNRFKEHGFTARRDEHGGWHVRGPDGVEIS